jgi:hypothetical protein
MSAYPEVKDVDVKETKGAAKGGKKGFSVQRVEGLQGLQDLLNQTEGGKVQSWQRVGEGATFIVVLEGVPVKEEPVAAPVEEAEEANGNKAKKKSA